MRMLPLRLWLRAPRSLMVLFFVVMLAPAVTLVVLGWRLLKQDRALETQRLAELREAAADRVVRSLEQSLAATEQSLAGEFNRTPSELTGDSLTVILGPQSVEAVPATRLLYYPVAPPGKAVPLQPFREAEGYEFRQQDTQKAADAYRMLSTSPEAVVRAGALLRLARVYRKAGRRQEALEAYQALARIPSVSIEGTPADLLARRARCAVLEDLGRSAELRQEAGALQRDLRNGRWRLDRPTYVHAAEQVSRWLPSEPGAAPEQEALTAAVEWLWKRWTETPREGLEPAGRQTLAFAGIPLTVLWRSTPERMVGLVAGPGYLERYWRASLGPMLRSARVGVFLTGQGGSLVMGGRAPQNQAKSQRSPSETGLPWGLVVVHTDAQAALGDFATRRRLLLAGLGAIAVLVTAGSYFIWRTIRRELAVAQLQTDFVSAVSHEFRTPLTSLRHISELLAEDDDLPAEKRRSFYQAQVRATDRLHRLVESLLDFARMEAGARPYRFQRLEAGAFVQALVEDFREEAGSQGFDLQCRVDAGGHPVDGDPDALARALWNLLDNAVKYSGNERAILVEVARRDASVAISVCDRGLGIPRGEQREIFRKFVRGANARTHGVKGSGIGLTMVRHIVEAHHGVIDLASAPGKGSTFTILLPARG